MQRKVLKCVRLPKGPALVVAAVLGTTCVLSLAGGSLGAGTSSVARQMSPMRQDSIKISPAPELSRAPISADTTDAVAQLPIQPQLSDLGGMGYDPSGRRDPFAPVVQELQPGKVDANLPPLQRVTLTELNLIAIVWGAYGYTAMVQTPEGHGYTVRRGTRIGQNNGVVSAITERGIIVQERFTDVYGKKQEREYVKLLHPKEGSE